VSGARLPLKVETVSVDATEEETSVNCSDCSTMRDRRCRSTSCISSALPRLMSLEDCEVIGRARELLEGLAGDGLREV